MTRMNKLIGAGVLLSLGALAALSGVASAAGFGQAQTPGATPDSTTPHVVRITGQVQSISGSALVLQAGKNRTLTVNTGSNTWVLVEKNSKCVEGQLSDIQAGKVARVAGMSTAAANTLDARIIAQRGCAREFSAARPREKAIVTSFLAKHVAAGKVKSINGTTITLTNAGGKDVTVNTSAQTVVLNNGIEAVSTIKVGDEVQVFGRAERTLTAPSNGASPAPTSARTITAWAIHDASAKTRVALARVTAVNGDTITIRSAGKRIGATVTLNGSTSYRALTVTGQTVGMTAAAQSDVNAGENLLIEATTSTDGKTTIATSVIILPTGKIK